MLSFPHTHALEKLHLCKRTQHELTRGEIPILFLLKIYKFSLLFKYSQVLNIKRNVLQSYYLIICPIDLYIE